MKARKPEVDETVLRESPLTPITKKHGACSSQTTGQLSLKAWPAHFHVQRESRSEGQMLGTESMKVLSLRYQGYREPQPGSSSSQKWLFSCRILLCGCVVHGDRRRSLDRIGILEYEAD